MNFISALTYLNNNSKMKLKFEQFLLVDLLAKVYIAWLCTQKKSEQLTDSMKSHTGK
jgi:hypothetical protein